MHLTCTQAQALFPSVGFRLFTEHPLSLLWDCHHGNTFIMKLGDLAVQPLREPAAAEITLQLSLAPVADLISKMEHFAAQQNLAVQTWAEPPEELSEPLTLAACHLPEAKLFVFSEQATLTARATPDDTLTLTVQGDFKSRTVPCQEADLLLHLERANSSHLLSYCFSVVRGKK
jgi:hypothetical protein